MKEYFKWKMWVNLVLPFCAVLLVALMLVSTALYFLHRQQEREHFAQIARKNAEFVRDMNLPLSETMAAHMSRVLGVHVFFILESGQIVPSLKGHSGMNRSQIMQLVPGRITALPMQSDAVICSIHQRARMLLVRPRPNYLISSWMSYAAIIVSGMLMVALMLGWFITQSLVKPLKKLAAQVPHLLEETTAVSPMKCASRHDEIGLLARTLVVTHERFLAERSARHSAERKAALSRVTVSLAHEIKNPVAAAQMQLQLLETSAPHEIDETLRRTIPMIKRELVRVEKLMNQWMYLINPNPSGMTACSLLPVLEDAINNYQAMARHACVEIRMQVEKNGVCYADQMRLSMVFENIIRNAIQAMPGGGRLVIELSTQNGCVMVTVADSGCGFSATAFSRAKDLFFTEKEGGMGVGLTVAETVVEAHGGVLKIANNQDAGACVTVLLPLSESGDISSLMTNTNAEEKESEK